MLLLKTKMIKSLDGKWKLSSSYLNNELEVNVPGSIYNDLLVNNIIDDPFYKCNSDNMLSLMNYDYTYSRTFTISKDDLDNKIYLHFLGLDTITVCYINGKKVLSTFNMHRNYKILVNDYLVEGNNKIEVVIKSCLDYIKKKQEECKRDLLQMEYAVPGYIHIRKASCMFGWDWGPQLPDGGIWRSVFLDFVNECSINEFEVSQDTNSLSSNVKVRLENEIYNENVKVTCELSFNNVIINSFTEEIKAINSFEFLLDKDNRNLWYPNGYGKQPLYEVIVRTSIDGKIIEEKRKKIGLRSIEVIQEDDKFGRSFYFKVNGIPIFIKGSDYIIEDNLLPRTNENTFRFLASSLIFANQNMIRVWGGAIYPNDYVYDICDELGILIWQDLMFACAFYNLDDKEWLNEVEEEIICNVKRIKHHACIGLICGNNEIEQALLEWNPPSKEHSIKVYPTLFIDKIPKLLNCLAPDIFYWSSSPSSFENFDQTNSDNYGDMHYWGVWHHNEPIESYRRLYPRFMSEFGLQSFPCMETINKFAGQEDYDINSKVMKCHQKNRTANTKILWYTEKMFKTPKDFTYLPYVSELIQAEGVKYCVEHLRRNYGRCMGALYWQLNDCWPVASWSSIDYYGNFKPLHYFARKFYSPILISVEENRDNKECSIYITNEKNERISSVIEWKLIDFKGNIIETSKFDYEVNGMEAKMIKHLKFDETYDFHNVILIIKDNNLNLPYTTITFVENKELNLDKVVIEKKLSKTNNNYELILKSDKLARYVKVCVNNENIIFSDNYFDLLPNEEYIVSFECSKDLNEDDIMIISLSDSYL